MRAAGALVAGVIAAGCLTVLAPAQAVPVPALPGPAAGTDEQLADLHARLTVLQAQVNGQRTELATAQAGLDALEVQLADAEETEALAGEARDHALAEAEAADARAAAARDRAEQGRAALGRAATRTYINGQTSQLAAVLAMVDAQDGNDVAQAMTGSRLVTQRRARQLEELRSAERAETAARQQSQAAAAQAASAAEDARRARERTQTLLAEQHTAVEQVRTRLAGTEQQAQAAGLQVANRQAALTALLAGTRTAGVPAPVPAGSVRAAVMADAAALTGIAYVYGGTTPAGFDCSGYTSYVMRRSGVGIPRTAAQQQAFAVPVTDPQPGDLVFFGAPAYHVGIYAGNGMMYDSPRTGKSTGLHRVYSSVSGYGRVLPG